jgi:hypothetical protein
MKTSVEALIPLAALTLWLMSGCSGGADQPPADGSVDAQDAQDTDRSDAGDDGVDDGIRDGNGDASGDGNEPDASGDNGGDFPEFARCDSRVTCGPQQECIAHGCVDPVDSPAAYVAEAAGREASFMWRLQNPSLFAERDVCCFDFNGDALPDNAFGDLLPVMATLLGVTNEEIQLRFEQSIQDGANVLVADWRQLPVDGAALEDGATSFSVFPSRYNPAESWEVRAAGDGHFRLEPEGFGPYGALVQFNAGGLASGTLQAGPSEFPLTIPDLGPGALFFRGMDIVLQGALLVAPLSLEANGVHTIDEVRGSPPDTYAVAGGMLGGVIPAGAFVDSMNRVYSTCACAGVTGNLVTGEEGAEEYDIHCLENAYLDPVPICCDTPGEPPGCVDGTVGVDCCASGSDCTYVPTMCQYLSIFASILDVDTNGNGVTDGMSAGFRIGLTGAAIEGLAE